MYIIWYIMGSSYWHYVKLLRNFSKCADLKIVRLLSIIINNNTNFQSEEKFTHHWSEANALPMTAGLYADFQSQAAYRSVSLSGGDLATLTQVWRRSAGLRQWPSDVAADS